MSGKIIDVEIKSRVAELLDQGLNPDEIGDVARKVQHEKTVADNQTKVGDFLLTKEQSAAVCDFLLAPPEPTPFPPNVAAYLTDLSVALHARDAATVSAHVLLALRAMILQRPDLVFQKPPDENKNLEEPVQPADQA